jgi:hypothetical protein
VSDVDLSGVGGGFLVRLRAPLRSPLEYERVGVSEGGMFDFGPGVVDLESSRLGAEDGKEDDEPAPPLEWRSPPPLPLPLGELLCESPRRSSKTGAGFPGSICDCVLGGSTATGLDCAILKMEKQASSE